MTSKKHCVATFLFCAALASFPLRAQQQPLITQPAEALAAGEMLISLGVDYFQEAEFPHSGLSGDLTRAGVLDLHLGVSRGVEFQIQGVVRNFLSVETAVPALVTPQLGRSGNSTSDTGDFTLAAKIQFLRERGRRPAFGIRFGFEMPNSNELKGIGLNTTNVFFSFLAQKHAGKANLFANLGAAILETPGGLFSQNDVVTYGTGLSFPLGDHAALVTEVAGRWSTRSVPLTSPLVGTGSRSQARLGFQFFGGGLRWHVAGVAGLTRRDPTTGVVVGVSKRFRINREGWPR